MKGRILLLGLVLILFVAYIGVVTIRATNGEETVYIRADGLVEPPSAPIQRSGDTYVLTDNITSVSDGIVVERNGITLDGSGYSLQYASGSNASQVANATGISLIGTSNVTIENMTVKLFAKGISLVSNGTGAVSDWNIITRNYLVGNGGGIYLRNSTNNHVFGNNVTGSSYGIMLANASNNSVDGNGLANILGVYVSSSNNNSVNANSISSFNDGIWLDSSSNNFITSNSVTATNGYGVILLGSSDYNDVVGNNLTDCDEGLNLRTSSSYNSIVGNRLEGNFRGFEFLDSRNNTIVNNDIADSGWFNFRMARCSDNVVYQNSITGNSFVLWLDSSANNTFYHNFMGSPGIITKSSTGKNTWDDGYPSGGNYWTAGNIADQLSGTYQNMTGNDGICDVPFVLDGNNTDRYPLAGPFYTFNATPQSQIQIISNSTITSFEFNGTAIRLNVEDLTNGFLRICIPTTILNGTFTVSVNRIQAPYTLLPESNATLNYLYVGYDSHSQEVAILPELSSYWILSIIPLAFAMIVACKTRQVAHAPKKEKG